MDQSQPPNILPSDVALGKKKNYAAYTGLGARSISHRHTLSREVLFRGFPDEEVEVQEGEESCSRSHSESSSLSSCRAFPELAFGSPQSHREVRPSNPSSAATVAPQDACQKSTALSGGIETSTCRAYRVRLRVSLYPKHVDMCGHLNNHHDCACGIVQHLSLHRQYEQRLRQLSGRSGIKHGGSPSP